MPAYDRAVERLRIGELLVQANVISKERLDDALTLQRAQGRKLGQVLTDLGIVNETQLTQALGQQMSVPWVSLHHIDFSRQLLNLVPREVAEKYCLIPIFVRRVRKHGDTLYVAMDDPTHEAALDAVRASSSMPVRPMIAAPTDIRSAIRVYYDADPPRVEPPPPSTARVGPPPLPASALRPVAAPAPPADADEPPASESSPHAWTEVEARTLEVPRRTGGPKMVAVTLLDGTTIQLPARARRRLTQASDEAEEAHEGPQSLANMTARDLIKGLAAVAEGADAREVFGDRVPLEAILATLLSLLLRKGLVADWEFVDELRKRR